jgi:transposase
LHDRRDNCPCASTFSRGEKKHKKKECIGKTRGGLATKIHATCDALGNPTDFHLTPGESHDLDGSDVLIPRVPDDVEKFLADKAYDAQERVIDLLDQKNIEAVIPSKSNRTVKRDYDENIYKERSLIENMFCKLKQYRAIATRYEKTAISFLGGIYAAASLILLT